MRNGGPTLRMGKDVGKNREKWGKITDVGMGKASPFPHGPLHCLTVPPRAPGAALLLGLGVMVCLDDVRRVSVKI